MGITFDEIRKEVERYAKIIEAPLNLLPTYGVSRDLAHPYIDIIGQDLYFLAKERGKEVLRERASDLHDLMFKVFKSITFHMALNYELQHRVEGQDFRIIFFAEQERLLGILDQQWEHETRKRHARYLGK